MPSTIPPAAPIPACSTLPRQVAVAGARTVGPVERALAAVPEVVAGALTPVRDRVPALALDLLVQVCWDQQRLRDSLFPDSVPATAARAMAELLEPGRNATSAAGLRLPFLPPPVPADLTEDVLSTAAEYRRTVLIATVCQRCADKCWQRIPGALWPRALPGKLQQLWQPQLSQLNWSCLALQPAGLGAKPEVERCRSALGRRLNGLLDVWQYRLQGALLHALIQWADCPSPPAPPPM